MRSPWHNGEAVATKTKKCYLSDAATNYKLLELQPVIWQMFNDAVKESLAFIFNLTLWPWNWTFKY